MNEAKFNPLDTQELSNPENNLVNYMALLENFKTEILLQLVPNSKSGARAS